MKFYISLCLKVLSVLKYVTSWPKSVTQIMAFYFKSRFAGLWRLIVMW